jgi:hypothetical protein
MSYPQGLCVATGSVGFDCALQTEAAEKRIYLFGRFWIGCKEWPGALARRQRMGQSDDPSGQANSCGSRVAGTNATASLDTVAHEGTSR